MSAKGIEKITRNKVFINAIQIDFYTESGRQIHQMVPTHHLALAGSLKPFITKDGLFFQSPAPFGVSAYAKQFDILLPWRCLESVRGHTTNSHPAVNEQDREIIIKIKPHWIVPTRYPELLEESHKQVSHDRRLEILADGHSNTNFLGKIVIHTFGDLLNEGMMNKSIIQLIRAFWIQNRLEQGFSRKENIHREFAPFLQRQGTWYTKYDDLEVCKTSVTTPVTFM